MLLKALLWSRFLWFLLQQAESASPAVYYCYGHFPQEIRKAKNLILKARYLRREGQDSLQWNLKEIHEDVCLVSSKRKDLNLEHFQDLQATLGLHRISLFGPDNLFPISQNVSQFFRMFNNVSQCLTMSHNLSQCLTIFNNVLTICLTM